MEILNDKKIRFLESTACLLRQDVIEMILSAGLAIKFMEKSNAENNIEIFSKEVISANITILGHYHIW